MLQCDKTPVVNIVNSVQCTVIFVPWALLYKEHQGERHNPEPDGSLPPTGALFPLFSSVVSGN